MARTGRKSERTLDESVILDAALKLVRRRGIEKLTMRALARQLGVSPMALYHHVPSKAALLDRIRASVIAVVPSARASFDETVARESQPALTEARIVEVALSIVREQTVRGLSMRELAQRLGVSPMALYHHVRNKEDLIERLRDAVTTQATLPEPSATRWQQQMRDHMVEGIMRLARYPGLSRPSGGRPLSEGDRRMTRYGISLLLAAGFAPKEAAAAISAVHLQALGLLTLADAIAEGRMPRRRQRASQDAVDVGAYLRSIDFQTVVEYSIDTMLRGLAVRLAEGKRARKRPPRRAIAKRTS